MNLRGLFTGGYIYTLRLKLPGGGHETVTVAEENFEKFCQRLFEAGMEFGAEHPELQAKAGTWR